MIYHPDNVLQLALANDELEKFIVGESFYFQEAKADNEEPQNVIAVFDQRVLPHWLQTRLRCAFDRGHAEGAGDLS